MQDFTLVTGGSGGIGRSIVSHLMGAGQTVVNFDIVAPSDGQGETFVEVDLADRAATAEAIGSLLAKGRVTRLVNNVAVCRPAGFADTTLEDLDRHVSVNLACTLQLSQAVVPAMREAGFGRIVHIGSRAGLGKELRTAYAATKAALVGMARTWALELGRHGITVNVVAPGAIGTPAFWAANPSYVADAIASRIPVRRLGTPDDVANAVRFLLAQESGFITGQTLYVCGGDTTGVAG